MAGGDYRSCDVCGGKTFYDAGLDYTYGQTEWGGVPFRVAGKPQYDKPEFVKSSGLALPHIGDWAVICTDCAKTHKCIVVPLEQA
jgi:hypothetical protein